VLGPTHSHTLAALTALGSLHAEMEDFVPARQLLREALQAARRALGGAHPDTLACMSSLGQVLLAEAAAAAAAAASGGGSGLLLLPEAHALCAEAWETARRALGEAHPHTQRYARDLRHVQARMPRQ
jgi:hypothetical protein